MTAIDLEATSPKHLADKYGIVGVGETQYMRGNGSGRTTRALGVQAIRAAMNDAGLKPGDIDGMLSYSFNDSTFSPVMAGDLGIRLNFYMDVYGPPPRRWSASPSASSNRRRKTVNLPVDESFSRVRIGGNGAR
jgi:hypothetical protein